MKKHDYLIDLAIAIIVAVCMIFLNIFLSIKLEELNQASRDAIFIKDNIEDITSEEIQEEIKDYLPSSCQMIELYDNNFNLIFQVQFTDDVNTQHNKNIKDSKNLINHIQSNKEGQTSFVIGNNEQDVYYKWLTNERGEDRLIMVYSDITNVKYLWAIPFICYIVIILVFVLLIRMRIRLMSIKCSQYEAVVTGNIIHVNDNIKND